MKVKMRLPDGEGGEVVLLLIGRPTALCGVVCEEIAGLIARVAADNAKRAGALAAFGGVTSTGEAKPMKRWVVTRGRWEVFSRDHGFIRRGAGVGKAGCVQPWYAASLDDARGVVELLGLVAVGIEEIEVAQREDGMLVEALYA